MEKQNELFNKDFDGNSYIREYDHSRLKGQALGVFKLMSDNRYRTLNEIHHILNYPEASISATLRDFRKNKFGNHTVNKRRRGNPKQGLFEYQLIINTEGTSKKETTKAQKKAEALNKIKELGMKLEGEERNDLRNIWVLVSLI
jgi:transcriptional/translational regulatory protein YebC/TACO1